MRTRGPGVLVAAVALALTIYLPAQAQDRVLEPCLAAAADFSPVYPTGEFPAGTARLSLVFRLGRGSRIGSLAAHLIAADAAGGGREVAHSEVRPHGRDRGEFRFYHAAGLAPGRYRVDVTADGATWGESAFSVVAPAPDAGLPDRPEGLIPLIDGSDWHYDFTLVTAPGVSATIAGARPGPDGSFHLAGSYRVVGHDDAGAHVELRAGGTLLVEEWWHLAGQGLVVTQRRLGGELYVADPPQLLLPWPLKAPKTWEWQHRDRSIRVRQRSQLWGPVPVEGPKGPAPGYVVLTEEPPGKPEWSIERHFLPGFGIVRQVGVQARDGVMLLRQELTLHR